MTAAERITEQQPHPLLPGASFATVRSRLLSEDRDRFSAEHQAASVGDPDGADGVLERYRQLAVLQSDPTSFRAMVRRVDEITTGVPPDEDEPLAVTRARTGI